MLDDNKLYNLGLTDRRTRNKLIIRVWAAERALTERRRA